ncbi:MAG TPA: hypothetical protein VHR66_09215 [Gemmataceae bacterium]|jgi:WD40 repeat protein|nr:hypothetical protein [Gemmataceae bacterium]
MWDAATGAELARGTLPDGTVGAAAIAISSDGSALAVAAAAKVFTLDTASGKVRQHLKGTFAICRVLAFAPDGKTLTAVGTLGGQRQVLQVHRWDTSTGMEVESFEVDAPVNGRPSLGGCAVLRAGGIGRHGHSRGGRVQRQSSLFGPGAQPAICV